MSARHTVKPKPPLKHAKAEKVDWAALINAWEKDPETIEETALWNDPERRAAGAVARSIQRGDSQLADTLKRDAPCTERFFREVVRFLDKGPGLRKETLEFKIVASWRAACFRWTGRGDPNADPTYKECEDQFVRLWGGHKETSGLTSEEKQTIRDFESRGFERPFIEDCIG
jgi:hypothetical protein